VNSSKFGFQRVNLYNIMGIICLAVSYWTSLTVVFRVKKTIGYVPVLL